MRVGRKEGQVRLAQITANGSSVKQRIEGWGKGWRDLNLICDICIRMATRISVKSVARCLFFRTTL